LNFAVQETTEVQAAGEDESNENVEALVEKEEIAEEELIAEEGQKEAEEAVDFVENETLDEICELTALLFILWTLIIMVIFYIRCSNSRARWSKRISCRRR
jgi:uncharacterized membrane protein